MADLGGFVGGLLAGQEYVQKQQLFPVELQEKQLDVQEKQLAIKSSEQLLDRQKKLLQLQASHNTQGQPDQTQSADTQAQALLQLAQDQRSSGFLQESGKTLEQASSIMKNNAEITSKKNEQTDKMWTHVSNLVGDPSIHDQAGFERAKMLFTTMYPEEAKKPEAQKLLQAPYSPQLVNALHTAATNALQQSEIEKNKAQAKSADTEASIHDYTRNVILPQEKEERAVRIDNLKKHGGDSLVPSKDDTNEIVNRIRDEYGKDVSKESAEVVASRIAPTVAQYRKQGMSPGAAADKAYREAKDHGEMKDLAKLTPKATTQVTLIDELISQVKASKASFPGITGLGGYVSRFGETVENITGTSDETGAKDFQSKLATLQSMLVKPISGSSQFSKAKQAEIAKIARGLSPGDTPQSTISALEQLKETITGPGRVPSAVSQAGNQGSVAGKVTRTINFDANGDEIQP